VQEINWKRQEGKPVPAKYVFKGIRRDGQIIFLETSARRLQYRGESVSLVFLRDITDRVQAEEELKASEEKYRLVVEHANEAIFIAQDGFLKLVNPKAVEITGYDQETLQTKPFPELIHPEDRAMVVDRHIRRVRGEDLPPVYSFRIIDREGQVKWVEINAVRIAWGGRPATLNFLSDITDRRLAEEALRESEERARLIFNTVPDSITITRVEDGRYMQVNDYFCQLTGYAREETIGRTVGDLNVFVNSIPEKRRQSVHHPAVRPADPLCGGGLPGSGGNRYYRTQAGRRRLENVGGAVPQAGRIHARGLRRFKRTQRGYLYQQTVL
jgi:PAS domain S-box-containing protein